MHTRVQAHAMLMNIQMWTQLPMQICVHTPRFAQLLCAKYIPTPADTQPPSRSNPIRVLQLLPCQDPGAAEGAAAGTKAAAFPSHSGLAEQPLPTTDTRHSPEEWLPPLLMPKCFVGSLGLHISWDLWRAELIPSPTLRSC